MAYRDNVQALCDKRRVPNPIREIDLGIAAINFMSTRTGTEVRISATDMNRGARLFFEDAFPENETEIEIDDALRARAKEYFAELYADVGEGKRALLDAFHFSDRMQIEWKPAGLG